MPDPTPKSFRLDQPTIDRLASLARDIQCSQADVLRYGLIALRTLLNDGYEFRDLNRTTIFKTSPDGRTTAFYDIGADGGLVDQGRMTQWTEMDADE